MIPLVCAPAALMACEPLRIEVPDLVTADAAAELAIAQKESWNECAVRHDALILCVKIRKEKSN